jgi:toxin FitB
MYSGDGAPEHRGRGAEKRWNPGCVAPFSPGWCGPGDRAPVEPWAQGRPVTRYVLDTNIISEVTQPVPSEALTAWMAEQADEDLFIASLTGAEIKRGLLEKPPGRKRRELERWFAGPEGPQALFAGRVLAFDEAAGLVWARLMAEGTAMGRPRSGFDMIIAAVAEANGCVVVTANEKDFAGVTIVNPLRGST